MIVASIKSLGRYGVHIVVLVVGENPCFYQFGFSSGCVMYNNIQYGLTYRFRRNRFLRYSLSDCQCRFLFLVCQANRIRILKNGNYRSFQPFGHIHPKEHNGPD